MKKFLFATHGTLAAGAKSTLELLIGNVADITCLTAYVNPDDNVDEQLKAYFSEVSDEDQVIVCTDLMGGSDQSENRSVRTEKKCISDSRIQSAAASGTGNERG